MDNKKIIKVNPCLIVLLLTAVIFAAAVLSVFASVETKAYAAELPSVNSVTAESVTETDLQNFLTTGKLNYTRTAYGDKYSRNVRIEFSALGASFYRIDTAYGANAPVLGTMTPVPSGETSVFYDVKLSGEITVIFTSFDENQITIGSVSKTVKSDNDKPSFASVNRMTDWLPAGAVFDIKVFLESFADELSGRGGIFYSINDGAITALDAGGDVFTLRINSDSVLKLYQFDNAGNLLESRYDFDKFDTVAPPKPEIILTPNVDPSQSNGYAGYFTVELKFYADDESGLSEDCYYVLNGQRTIYTGPFRLDEARTYELKAYAVDNAGNVSAASQVTVPSTSFDRVQPSVNNLTVEYDVRSELPCTITFVSSDQMSGIKYAYIEGTSVYFTLTAGGVYRASVDCYGKSGLVVLVEDRAGNVSVNHVAVNYFGIDSIAAVIRSCAEMYNETDFSLYTEEAVQSINDCYVELNALLSSDLSQTGDFKAVSDKIAELISGKNKFVYSIQTPTEHLSGALTFEVNIEDFAGYKIGDEIKLVFNAEQVTGEFVSLSGFSEGFYDVFSLNVYHNGTAVSDLADGIKISLNMPVGYYERNYKLINVADMSVVETSAYNNKIEFKLNKSGVYALVVSGSPEKAGTQTGDKTISVFGRELSYGVFFGTVFGVAGAAIIAIVVIVIVAKRRRG